MSNTSDYIVCKICGNHYKRLTYHINKTHNMSKDEYLELYPDSEFLSESERSIMSSRMTDKNNENWTDPEYRKSRSEFAESQWMDPKYRALKIAQVKDQHKYNEGYKEIWRESARSRVLELWKDPDFVSKIKLINGERLREWNIQSWKDPDYRREMINRICRSAGRRVSYNGTNYRSGWEIYFVKYLESNSIRFDYEINPVEFLYDGKLHTYIPDFYLPDLNIYVEIHPECFINDYMKSKIKSVERLVLLTENELFVTDFSIYDFIDNPRLSVDKYL